MKIEQKQKKLVKVKDCNIGDTVLCQCCNDLFIISEPKYGCNYGKYVDYRSEICEGAVWAFNTQKNMISHFKSRDELVELVNAKIVIE